MSKSSKILATGLSTAALLTGCGFSGEAAPDKVLRVGYNEWVKPKDGNDECVAQRGAKLVIKEGVVTYETRDNGGGTSCESDTVLDLPVREALIQDEEFDSFQARHRQIVEQVREMKNPKDVQLQEFDWVASVNPNDIQQRWDAIGYGDVCAVKGKVIEMGQLSTGESVRRVPGPVSVAAKNSGTSCPPGLIYLHADPEMNGIEKQGMLYQDPETFVEDQSQTGS